jgi:TolA-binding protein
MEEQAQVQRTQVEELRKEVFTLNQRVQALEQQAVAAKTPPPAPPKPKVSLETMKKAYHEEDYQEAIEQGKLLIKSKTPDSAKIHFLLADSYYVSKDFASAALEYSEFKKSFPKDSNIASAIYKQAVCFKNLGKGKEARLFFQELVDRFPKHALAAKARAELKKSK